MDFSILSRAFGSFVRTVSRYPIASLFTTGLLTWGATIFIVVSVLMSNYSETLQFVDKWFPSPDVENARLQESVPRDLRTCREIERLGIGLNADRATFFAFSNGTLGTGGVPWNYASVHCPYVADGIAFIPEEFQKTPNAPSAEIHMKLFPGTETTACGVWTADEIKSSYIRAALRAVGTDVIYECGVRDMQGIAIGKIVVSWRDRNKVQNPEKVLPRIEQAAAAIGVINSLSVPKDEITEEIQKHETQ